MSAANRIQMSNNLSKQLSKTISGAAAAMLSLGAMAQAQVVAGTVRRDSMPAQARGMIVLRGQMDSITVIVNRIAQQRYGSPAWIDLTTHLDSFVANSIGKQVLRSFAGRAIAFHKIQLAKGYLGFNTQGPTVVITDTSGAQRYRFLAYQPIISVDLGSPADRAGIEPGDLIVAYNGVDLINHEFNFGDMLVPKKRVDVTVRRAGELKDYALTVASTPDEVFRRRQDFGKDVRLVVPEGASIAIADDEPPSPMASRAVTLRGNVVPSAGTVGEMTAPVRRVPAGRLAPARRILTFTTDGLFGAGLTNSSEDLAKAIHIRKGILVVSVPEETPAFRGGLRTGDVIVAADDDTVSTVGQLRDLVLQKLGDHSVELQIVRQQKLKKLTISWPE